MKRLAVFAVLLLTVGALMFSSGDAMKRLPGTLTTVNVATVTDSPYTEIARVNLMPPYRHENQADLVMIRINATSLSGGTEALIRVLPAWTATSTAISADPFALCYADGFDSSAVSLSGSREVIVAPRWGKSDSTNANTFHVLPPYLAIELQENHTSGSIVVETLLLYKP